MKIKNLNLLVILFSLIGFSQNESIIAKTAEFDYLIGTEYSDLSELSSLTYKGQTRRTDKDSRQTCSTTFVKGDYQIITSEIVTIDPKSFKTTHIIKDIIVLDGNYYGCEGCFISNKKDYTIKSFHPFNNVGKETALVVFEKNNETGKFKLSDFNKYKWNSNSDKLRRRN
ncbi:hypothetical protein ACOKFD_03560 [Flagellimonas sp. S174]|uniref:hypothetical protein n=1 Tax=Flagellimonas sp. S174 TaxID=3410790 RepID=UPI003BF4AA80